MKDLNEVVGYLKAKYVDNMFLLKQDSLFTNLSDSDKDYTLEMCDPTPQIFKVV